MCVLGKFEAEVHDPPKHAIDLIHLTDSMSSKVVIPGTTLKEGASIENHLDQTTSAPSVLGV